MNWSDYIVYVDESGDHGLRNINPEFPVFVLSFCIFNKRTYSGQIVPALMDFKFTHFGHDMVVLHEHDIRKQKGAFGILRNRDVRESFMTGINEFITNAQFTLIAVVIDKQKLIKKYKFPSNPYEIAMQFGLERTLSFFSEQQQCGNKTHVVFERRGNDEDRDLELEFRRVCAGSNFRGQALQFDIQFASKRVNSCGLQLADLTARPIGLSVMRPDQPNRAFEILKQKLYRKNSRIEGWGLKIFP